MVVVQVTVKIVLKDFEILIEHAPSQLILLLDQRCDIRRGEYLDSENGQTFWLVVLLRIAANSIDMMFYMKARQLN